MYEDMLNDYIIRLINMLPLTYLWFWGNRGCLKLFSVLEINNLGLLTIVTMVCKKTQTPFFFVTPKLSAPWPTIALFPSFFCSSCHMVCPGFCELEAENLKIIFSFCSQAFVYIAHLRKAMQA